MDVVFQGKGTAADLIGDRVVFRNLRPIDPVLPGLADLRGKLHIPEDRTPRKIDTDYGRVISEILAAAQRSRQVLTPLQELIYIGDTPGSDGAAFSNILAAEGWRGAQLICTETGGEASLEIKEKEPRLLTVGSHWKSIRDFEASCLAEGFRLEEGTAVILDLDKTLLGARGRNDGPINQARVAAVHFTVRDLLGPDFDEIRFQDDYQVMNQGEYHFFTGDNQDYVAYICVILGSGLINLEETLQRLGAEWTDFNDLVSFVEARKLDLTPGLREFHQGFMDLYRQGDPTPLKRFRRREYLETVDRMRADLEGDPGPAVLDEKIVLTGEIYQAGLAWQKRGVLLLGLSDKPDEASIPTRQAATEGLEPIHRVEAYIYGSQ